MLMSYIIYHNFNLWSGLADPGPTPANIFTSTIFHLNKDIFPLSHVHYTSRSGHPLKK